MAVLFLDITERKNAEEALRKGEAKYRGLFENIHDGVSLRRLIYDKRGEIVDAMMVDANRAALRIYGVRSIDELREKKHVKATISEMMDAVLDVVKKLKDTGGRSPSRCTSVLMTDIIW